MTTQDVKLENMNILEKVTLLESLITKAELDGSYASTVIWQGDREDAINHARVVIENARTLFGQNRIDTLEPQERAAVYADYHVQIDTQIKMFPEYQLNDSITESVDRTQMHL